ncbi:MAG: hypothetical protein V7776_23130 [Halopseudomonas aestusnigri]
MHLGVKPSISEGELQAYVDGQLTSDERRRVEAYLGKHLDDAERVNLYRKQNIGLHGLFDPISKDENLDEIPPEMAEVARQLNKEIRSSRPHRNRNLYYFAIMCVLLVAFVIILFLMH